MQLTKHESSADSIDDHEADCDRRGADDCEDRIHDQRHDAFEAERSIDQNQKIRDAKDPSRLRCECEEERKQGSAPPRWATEHLNVSGLLFLIKFDLSDDLDMFGSRSSLLWIFWIVVDTSEDLQGFLCLVLVCEITWRLWYALAISSLE